MARKKKAAPAGSSARGKATLLGVNCLAEPYHAAHDDTSSLTYRIRSDVWLRFWRGDRAYIEGWNGAVDKVRALGAVAPHMTLQPPSAFGVFVWHQYSDIAHEFLDVEGYPVSVVDAEGVQWGEILSLYPPLPPRSPADMLHDMLEIDDILRRSGVHRILMPLDYTRAPPEIQRKAETESDVTSALAERGWQVTAVPSDAPAGLDGNWTHYDRHWVAQFVAETLPLPPPRHAVRVILSGTTYAGRNGTVQPTIDSLLAQTYRPDDIRLYCQPGCEDLPVGDGLSRIPCPNYGAVSKLTAVLDARLEPETIIVTYDDDTIYPPGWLATLVADAEAHPRCAVGHSGWRIDRIMAQPHGWVVAEPPGRVDVLEGYAGIAYRRWFFGADALDLRPQMRRSDDVSTCAYLHRHGIACIRTRDPVVVITPEAHATGLHSLPDFKVTTRSAVRLGFGNYSGVRGQFRHPAHSPLLTICICSLHSRHAHLMALLEAFRAQPRVGQLEILVSTDGGHEPVYAKRNRLHAQAAGRFIVSFDDDDLPAPTYVAAVLDAIESSPDASAVLIRAEMTRTDGGKLEGRHDKVILDWRLGGTDGEWVGNKLWRTPAHLCPIRADLAKAHPVPAIVDFEDVEWGRILAPHLVTAVRAGKPGEMLYFYRADFSKPPRPPIPRAAMARASVGPPLPSAPPSSSDISATPVRYTSTFPGRRSAVAANA